jgi:hypothetical protein
MDDNTGTAWIDHSSHVLIYHVISSHKSKKSCFEWCVELLKWKGKLCASEHVFVPVKLQRKAFC